MKMLKRRIVPTVWIAILGSLGLVAIPAHADGGSGTVPVSFNDSTPNGTRTLVLESSDGTSTSPSVDLSSGPAGFIAEVQDSGVALLDGGFNVSATMSNLYQENGGTFSCSDPIPSSAITLSSIPGLLSEHGLSTAVAPVLTVTGDLASVLNGVTGLVGLSITDNPVIPLNVNATLTQATEAAGSTLSTLVGSVLSQLPMGLNSSSGSFANPDQPPAGSGCPAVTGIPSSVTFMSGVLQTPDLLSELIGQLEALAKSTTVTLANLVSDNLISASQAESLVSQATGIPTGTLDTNGLLGNIESTLTVTVNSLTSALEALTGDYDSEPVLSVKLPANQPAGRYQGVMTVTLADNPPSQIPVG